MGLVMLVAVALAGSAGPARGQSAPPALGRYHALVIGNQQYRALPSLKTPAADVTALADLLRKDYGFNVRLLVNATRVQMVDALADMRGKLGERDNLLIYYAGHGYLAREAARAYWMAVDADRNSPANWVSNADITDALRANAGITDVTTLFAGLRRSVLLKAEQTPQSGDVRLAARARAQELLQR
jgi:uncharacterized caspase-like protein